jgi:uncharacterized protein (DUF849 family)
LPQSTRVGKNGFIPQRIEDSPQLAAESFNWPRNSAQLVARLARIARECGREAANPAEARQIFGLI